MENVGAKIILGPGQKKRLFVFKHSYFY
jgi:hypothetical protein